MLLGGRAAEAIIYGDVSGGASNDIQRASEIARKMVTQLGMSDVLGLRAFGSGQGEVFLGRDFSSTQDYSDETASKIDNEIHSIISEAYENAKRILTENMSKMHFIAEFLVKNEIMDGEQFAAAMEGTPTIEELEEMTEAKKRKSREENEERRRQQEAAERRRKEAEERARKNGAGPNANSEGWGYVSASDDNSSDNTQNGEDTVKNSEDDNEIPH